MSTMDQFSATTPPAAAARLQAAPPTAAAATTFRLAGKGSASVAATRAACGVGGSAAVPARTSLDTLQTSAHLSSNLQYFAQKLENQPPHQAWLHAGWEVTRKQMALGLVRCGMPTERVYRFCDCGQDAWVYRNIADPSRYKLCSNHCGDRLCLPCGRIRAHLLQSALEKKLASLARPPLFITLTLAGQPNEPLRDKIDRLYTGFSDLRRLKFWRDHVVGGGAFLEIKWSDKAQRWHPHLHILADASFMKQADLSDKWRAVTGDSYIVDVRRSKSNSEVAHYVVKYCTKPINASFAGTPALLDEAILAMKGRRLFLTFGDWYGIKLKGAEDEEITDQPLDSDHWTSAGSLAEILARAAGGDIEAAAALRSIRHAGARTMPLSPSG